MAGSVANLIHEPVWVLLGVDEDTLANLGYINTGDVTVTPGINYVDQMTHQTGALIVQKYENGQTLEITLEFAEIINWDVWAAAFRMGEEQEDAASPPLSRFASHTIAGGADVGTKGTTKAQMLVLRPMALYVDDATETARDFVVPQALCTNVDSIPFGIETPHILPVTFEAIGDPSATDGSVLWHYGPTTPTTDWVVA